MNVWMKTQSKNLVKEKDKQLYSIIERKITKEKHKRKEPTSQDRTIKKCKSLLNEGADFIVLIKLEELFREREEYHSYYIQCFLPVLIKEVLRELDSFIKRKEVEGVIFNILGEVINRNFCNNYRDSYHYNGIGNSSDDKIQITNWNSNISSYLLETVKQSDNIKIERRGCTKERKNVLYVSIKKGIEKNSNNILHYDVLLLQEWQRMIEYLNLSVGKEKICKTELSEVILNSKKWQLSMRKLLVDKIINKGSSFEEFSLKIRKIFKIPFVKWSDSTIKFAIALFKLRFISISDFFLPREELRNLDREYERCYLKFLERLSKSIKEPELKQEIKTQIKKILSYTINTPDVNGNYLLHSAINNYDKRFFLKLLQMGADINFKGVNGDNALHRIALLKREHKIIYLKLILDLKEEGMISLKALRRAINTKNNDNRYPAQVALIRQVEKIPSKLKDFSKWIRPRPMKRYYTAEFCAMLLQNGSENKSDHITIERYDNKKYYHTKERIHDLTGICPTWKVNETLNKKFSKNKKRSNSIDFPVVRWVFGGLVFAAVFSAFAGNMSIASTLSIVIAICAVCYPIYIKLEKFFRNVDLGEKSFHLKCIENFSKNRVDSILVQSLKDCEKLEVN
ncbi:MAG: hypothetical protein LJI21_00250 [Wolbachia endosymbiont of Menacanthus eurysternus]|nr:MAG: hypothetical protein LJI21_00250 [Wolbachia endosymbiont of Menacanthus eurysternus]